MKLQEIGEFGLIERLSAELKYQTGVLKGVGDDAAVLDFGDRWLLFTTDAVVEGVHFRLEHVTVEDIGYKALAVNISDIAAMGGKPTYALLTVGLPDRITIKDVEGLYRGLKEAAAAYGVQLVGGDTTRSPVLILNIALLGEAPPFKVRYRSGALPGDIICVTGSLGGAAAGLFLQENEHLQCPEPLRNFLLRKHRRPEPRVEAGLVLSAISQVHALIDISDGLASEVRHIAYASRVGCQIFKAAVPIEPAAKLVGQRAGLDPLDWALYGGEDYELLFAIAPEATGEVSEALAGCGAACLPVCRVLQEQGLWLVLPDWHLLELTKTGFDHFAAGC